MSHVVCAVFENEGQAERALAETGVAAPVDAAVQTGHWRDEDVQIGGSQARAGAILMGTAVGLFGAVIAWAFVWPSAGIPLSAWAMLPMTMAGSVFGIVAGAVGGASECKPHVAALAREVDARGHVVVICDVERAGDAQRVRDALVLGGGLRVSAA